MLEELNFAWNVCCRHVFKEAEFLKYRLSWEITKDFPTNKLQTAMEANYQ